MYTGEGMANYAELFRLFTKAENYPIDFHCIAGADRTGTLAFLLESTLGYSEEDIRRDYTYTTQYAVRHFSATDSLIAGMNAYGTPDEPLLHKAERYLLVSGVTADEIFAFQKIMLGEGLNESPVLQKVRVLEKIMDDFNKEASVNVIDNAPIVGMMLQCRQLQLMTLNKWLASPVKFVGADGKGRILVQLANNSKRENYTGFHGAGLVGSYKMMDVNNKKFYGVFTAEELENTPFVLKAQAEYLLILEPALDDSVPEGYTAEALPKPKADYLRATRFAEAPVIDGKADDIWSTATPLPLSDNLGNVLESNGGDVRIATNAAHDTLYFLVNVEDDSPVGASAAHDSDASWTGDDVEIFVSSAGSRDYYHFICGRGGCTFDEKGTDISWNWEGARGAATSCDDFWTAEFALPLGPLNLDEVVEVNVCIAGVPGDVYKYLRSTGAGFHVREAFVPVWLESAGEAEKR